MRARRTSAAAGVALALALLAGCSTEVPQPDPDPVAETPPPALDEARFDRVLQEVAEAISAGDEARDPEVLSTRVTGPALDLRSGEYRLAEATDGEAVPEPITTAPQVQAVSATADFPRIAMAITEMPEGANLPLLVTLVQPEPREQYKLWGWVQLFPGVQTPALTHPEAGSAVVAPDADTLVATPTEVVERFVATINDTGSEFAPQFAADPYRDSLLSTTAELDEAVQAAGDATLSAEVGDDGPVSIATADGGAIVMGELRSELTFQKTVAGSELRAGGAIGALLGDDTEVRGSVTGISDVLVAFYVPPADAEDTTIQALGATTVLVEVTRDDSSAPAEE
ncbi:hypothetical protein [Georgenia subflava]|uniref:DUF8094 domain-containing protein n=1 Tax=Georgenia subflava TaxID=1622177 RepID=A0A6N7EID0_9MICO|nr:hypothetical protein [Georgenia subflava]MPV38142.1 hypothetical protein [Georgenia subflava]